MFKKRCKSKSGYFDIVIGLKDFKPGDRGLKQMPRPYEAIDGFEIYGTSRKRKYIDVFEISFNGKKIPFTEASKKVIFIDKIDDRGYALSSLDKGNLLIVPSTGSNGLLIQLSWMGDGPLEQLTWAVTPEQGMVFFCSAGPP